MTTSLSSNAASPTSDLRHFYEGISGSNIAVVSAFEILVAIYLAVVPPALGFLFWGRLNSLEARVDSLGSELRAEMRAEFSDVRKEIAALRSDLTQVALAVGTRPRASEA